MFLQRFASVAFATSTRHLRATQLATKFTQTLAPVGQSLAYAGELSGATSNRYVSPRSCGFTPHGLGATVCHGALQTVVVKRFKLTERNLKKILVSGDRQR
jgi:hypothetical protein